MWKFWRANLVFVVVSAVGFLLESRYHALPQIVEYLGVSQFGVEMTPAMALVLIAALFVALGMLLKFNGALITAPLIFGAAHLALAGPQLLPTPWVQYSQIDFAVIACAIIGSFILMDARSMFRLRSNRFWLRLWVAISIAAVNYTLFLLFSKGLGSTWFIAVPVAIAAFIFFGVLSEKADEARKTANNDSREAARVPGLEAQIKEQTERADKNYTAWNDRGTTIDGLKATNTQLSSRVAELEAAAKAQAERADKNFKGWQDRGVELDALKADKARLEGRLEELERALEYKRDGSETSVTPLKAA